MVGRQEMDPGGKDLIPLRLAEPFQLPSSVSQSVVLHLDDDAALLGAPLLLHVLLDTVEDVGEEGDEHVDEHDREDNDEHHQKDPPHAKLQSLTWTE